MSDRAGAQLARFGGWTLVSAVVTLGLPVLLHEGFGIAPREAVAAALAAGFFLNFLGLRRFVFRSAGRGAAGGELARFAAASLAFRLLEYGLFLILLAQAGLPYWPALLVSLGLSFGLKFLGYRRFVFRRPPAPGS